MLPLIFDLEITVLLPKLMQIVLVLYFESWLGFTWNTLLSFGAPITENIDFLEFVHRGITKMSLGIYHTEKDCISLAYTLRVDVKSKIELNFQQGD